MMIPPPPTRALPSPYQTGPDDWTFLFESTHDQIRTEVLVLRLNDVDELEPLARGTAERLAWLKRQTHRHKRAEVGSGHLVEEAIAVHRY